MTTATPPIATAVNTLDEPTREQIRKAIEKAPTPGRHCARSALRHIEKAKAIVDIDPEFAVFHTITAEEEAATAVFRALQRLKYAGADKLNGKNHLYKAALLPFLRSVGEFLFSEAKALKRLVQLRYDERDIKKPFIIRLYAPGSSYALDLRRPFDFEAKINDESPDFAAELEKLVTVVKAKTIEGYIRQRAGERNQVLYAAGHGIPSVKLGKRYIPNAEERVLAVLLVYLMIDKHNPPQPFAQQALGAFLKLLGRIDGRLKDEF